MCIGEEWYDKLEIGKRYFRVVNIFHVNGRTDYGGGKRIADKWVTATMENDGRTLTAAMVSPEYS